MPETVEECGNPECRIATSGKCVEGLVPAECPHYGQRVPAVPDQTTMARKDFVSLASASRLSLNSAASLRRAGAARVAAVVGPTDSGKTSLIASVYDLFQVGPVGTHTFARSQTLHAFEEACHKARAASRRIEPGIPRTPVGGLAFYHLQIASGPGTCLDLLLADRAGEDYRAVADDPAGCKAFVEIQRADTISVLVDGARLVDTTARHNVRSEVLLILQGLIDGQAIRPAQKLALVLTKTDEVEASDQRVRVHADFESILRHVRSLFNFASVEPFRVAASPKVSSPGIEKGYGVPDLLVFWTLPYLPAATSEPAVPSPRAFGRFSALG